MLLRDKTTLTIVPKWHFRQQCKPGEPEAVEKLRRKLLATGNGKERYVE